MRQWFLGFLLFVSTFSFAETKEDCSYGLREILKNSSLDSLSLKEALKKEYPNFLMCLDPCRTSRDAQFLADQCVDWEKVTDLVNEKSSALSVISFLFEGSLNKCSAKEIIGFRTSGQLSDRYFDPRVNDCVDLRKTDIPEQNIDFGANTYNSVSLSLMYFIRYAVVTNNPSSYSLTGDPIGAHFEVQGMRDQIGKALFSWGFKVSASPAIGHISRQAAFELLAEIEGGIYKTFGKDKYGENRCRPYLGVSAEGSAHVYAGGKDKEYDSTVPSRGVVSGLVNSARMDPKVLDTALKAGFGFLCTNATQGEAVYRIELQGDLVRVSMFHNMEKDQGRAFAYNHAGKQVNIKGSIHHYGKSKITPFFEGNLGVGNYTFPELGYSAIETSLDTTIGAETKEHLRIGFNGRLKDLYWKSKNGKDKNILDLYLGFQFGGIWY